MALRARLAAVAAWIGAACVAGSLVVACGGGGSAFVAPTTGPGTGSSAVANVTLTTSAASVPTDGSANVTIHATALNSSNVAVEGVTVNFGASAGGLVTVTSATTDANGTATATLASNGAQAGTSITVTGAVGGASGQVVVNVINAQQTVSVTTNNPQLASNNSQPATITALVLSPTNQTLPGVLVTFQTSSGAISPASVATGANGAATATLTTGGDPTDRTITVTATAGASTHQVLVNVVGTTITLSGPSSLIENGAAGTYNVSLTDSGGTPIANLPVAISSSAGNTLSSPSVVTNAGGQATFTMTAVSATSPDTLTASGAGAVAKQPVTISSQSFSFTSPSANTAIPIGTSEPITVTWYSGGNPVANQPVTFSATRGVFTGGVSSITTTTSAGGIATVNISSQSSGPAEITATASASGTNVSGQLPVTFIAGTPTLVVLNASPATIQPLRNSTISATVTDAFGNLVANQPVNFQLPQDPTGGSLSVGTALTNAQGVAQTVYTATSTTSATPNDITVTGTVQGVANPGTTYLTVGGQAVSLVLGTGAILGQNGAQTQFLLPYTVLAVDSAGNPVVGAQITLQIQPNGYQKGVWAVQQGSSSWVQNVSAKCPNTTIQGVNIPGDVATVSPATVTTDSTGSATFNVIYQQDRAQWVYVDLTASAPVQGSQSTATADFWLPQLASFVNTVTANPPGQISPYGQDNLCTDTK